MTLERKSESGNWGGWGGAGRGGVVRGRRWGVRYLDDGSHLLKYGRELLQGGVERLRKVENEWISMV